MAFWVLVSESQEGQGQQQPNVTVSLEFPLNSELKLCNGLCINGKKMLYVVSVLITAHSHPLQAAAAAAAAFLPCPLPPMPPPHWFWWMEFVCVCVL